jgi:hypothetical protein
MFSPCQVNGYNKSSIEDPESHRIKLDLSKVYDKFKDMKKPTVASNIDNIAMKNIQVLYSK